MADVMRALVTGGGKGVGLVISRALMAAGWSVSACGRSAHSEVEFETYVSVDISQPGEARRLVGRLGPLPDALICNAGDYGELGPFAESDVRRWRASFDLNLFAVVEMVHEYLGRAHLEPSATRRKVVIVGGAGVGGGKLTPGMSAYACAKAALVQLAESLSLEEPGIDINVLAPGALATGITTQAAAAGLATSAPHPQAKAHIERAVTILLSPALDGVSGRLFSARWDAVAMELLAGGAVPGESFLRLRRIDEDLFRG